jgi:tetratricopeptide repeat protein
VIERLLEAERALSVGLLEQAEHLYQQAWEADPHNSIAVAGLARVALERGDEATAHALGLRALEIDEDNPAARRLVDRLVEVQATRARGRTPPGSAAPPEPSVPEATRAGQAEPAELPRSAAAPRSRQPRVGPPAAIRTSSSGKRRASPPPSAGGPTLPKARPLSPPTPKPPLAERPPAAAPQQGPARPAAKRPAPPKPGESKPAREPGLLDRLFGPRR